MPTIPPHIIDEVRLATDVVELVSGYVSLKKSGRNFFGLCPFHSEKTPSFSVNPEKQIFHCFGCSAGGSVFAFTQRIEGVGFPEAVRVLAKRAGIAIPEPEIEDRKTGQEKETLYFVNQLAAELFQKILFEAEGKIGREYLHGRGFDDDALRRFGVGFAPNAWDGLLKHTQEKSVNPDTLVKAGLLNPREKDGKTTGHYDRFRNRIMFPIQNLSGRVVAFGGRRIIDDESPKYINSPETLVYQKGSILYGFDLARDHLRSEDRLIVVEGYLDVMRMHLCGLENTVATSGTALTEHQARLIMRYTKNATLLFDSDAAGSAATLRGADILLESGIEVSIATLDAGEDPDSFLLKNKPDEMRRIVREAPSLFEYKALHPIEPSKDSDEQLESNRKEQLRSIIESLARMSDGLDRQAMVHRMSEKMNVDEEVLWEEVGRLRRTRNLRHRNRNRNAQTQAKAEVLTIVRQSFVERCRPAELELIRVMALHWDAIQFVFSFMRLGDFHDPQTHEMAGVFHDLLSREVPLEPEDIMHLFIDPEQAGFVSSVINERKELNEEVDYRRWSADCMVRLQKFMIEDKLQELRDQIKDREKSGGDVEELMHQYNELQKQLLRIKPENFLIASN